MPIRTHDSTPSASVWVIEDNDEYRQVLVAGLPLIGRWEVRPFESPESALRALKEISGGGQT